MPTELEMARNEVFDFEREIDQMVRRKEHALTEVYGASISETDEGVSIIMLGVEGPREINRRQAFKAWAEKAEAT